ncbi:hypothetical protein P3T39_005195 [Kitasatospora sp. GP82]|nr:hypothetical protein [Kitasatospora sp. GP82]
MLVTLVAVEAVGTAAYVVVHAYVAFLLLACLVTAVDRGASAVRNALYAEVLPADRRVAGRAYLRVVTNVGIGAGTVLAALALQADTRSAYVTAFLGDVLSFAVVAVLFSLIPVPARAGRRAAEAGERPGGRNPALRNLPFLAVTVLNSLLGLQFAMLEVGVPLWIVKHTEAPRVMVAGSMIVNTVLVVALQLRATRGTEKPEAEGRIFGRGGFLVAASCLVRALASGVPGWAAALLVVGGVGLQALGVVFSQAAGWALSYDLAGEGAHGAYQGVFGMGMSATQMLGPALVTTVVIAHGLIGWTVLAAVFVVGGSAMTPTVRWARRRNAAPAAPA